MKSTPMLSVIVRPLLVSGILAEDRNGRPAILIDDSQRYQERSIAFWHEIVHLVLSAGADEPHDENEVERLAVRLHQAWPVALGRIRRGK